MIILPVLRREFYARKWPLIVIFCPILAFLFTFQVEINKSKDALEWLKIGTVLLAVLSYFILANLKLIIDNEGLELKMLLRTERILWQSITESRLSFEINERCADVKWPFESNSKEILSFSPTFFSRASLKEVADALVSRKPDAQISEKVKRMAEGKFPWYIF